MMHELIDEMSLGMSFEVHRAAKIGTLFLDETDSEYALFSIHIVFQSLV